MRGIGGEVEAAVMAAVWDDGRSMTVREVLDVLNARAGHKTLAYTTVLTVMGNLAKKRMLDQHTDGRAYRYTASVTREQHTADVMNEALRGTTDRTAALRHFAAQLDPDERNALLDHARRLRRRRRS